MLRVTDGSHVLNKVGSGHHLFTPYVAKETVYFGRSIGFEICTTAPYSPESNGMAEAFVKTFKRDYIYIADLRSAQRVLEQLLVWSKIIIIMPLIKG